MQDWLQLATDWCQFKVFMQDRNRQREITVPNPTEEYALSQALCFAQSISIFQSAGSQWSCCQGVSADSF